MLSAPPAMDAFAALAAVATLDVLTAYVILAEMAALATLAALSTMTVMVVVAAMNTLANDEYPSVACAVYYFSTFSFTVNDIHNTRINKQTSTANKKYL